MRGAILSFVLAAISYPLAALYEEPRLPGIIIVLSLSVFVGGLANPKRIMLQRDLVFWQEFVLNVSQKIAGFVVTVAVAMIYHSYWALVVGVVVSQVVMVGASYLVMPFMPRIKFGHIREFLSFSIWITAGQIVNTLNWRFDYLLIGKFLDTSSIGFYSLGGTLAATPTREATAPLTAVIYPAFANVRSDVKRLAAAYQRSQALVTAIALPAGIGTAVVADPLVRLALGEKWLPSSSSCRRLLRCMLSRRSDRSANRLGWRSVKPRRCFSGILRCSGPRTNCHNWTCLLGIAWVDY